MYKKLNIYANVKSISLDYAQRDLKFTFCKMFYIVFKKGLTKHNLKTLYKLLSYIFIISIFQTFHVFFKATF